MPQKLHAVLLILTVFAVYVWLQVPLLNQYSLQAFAVAAAIYLILKRLDNAKWWHVVPSFSSIEMIVATFGFLLLVGATGNTESVFYPLAYLHLFFITFTCHRGTALLLTLAIMGFHYGMTPELTLGHVVELGMIPIMATIFLFARQQYDEVRRERELLEEDELILQQLSQDETEALDIINGSLLPAVRRLDAYVDHLPSAPQALRDTSEQALQQVRELQRRLQTDAGILAESQQEHEQKKKRVHGGEDEA
jgi:DNA repair exonuclease SbcCD ATPase subunit